MGKDKSRDIPEGDPAFGIRFLNQGFSPESIQIKPRKYDVSISLYGIEGRLLAVIREGLINLVPANVDISISSDETTEEKIQPVVDSWDVANLMMERGLLDPSLRKGFVEELEKERFTISRSEDV